LKKITIEVVVGIDIHKTEGVEEVIDMRNRANDQPAIGGNIGVFKLDSWIEAYNTTVVSPNGCLGLQLNIQAILHLRIS